MKKLSWAHAENIMWHFVLEVDFINNWQENDITELMQHKN